MASDGATVNQWSKDPSHHGHGHQLKAENTGSRFHDLRGVDQTQASVQGQTGFSSGLPLSAHAASSTVPIYDAKPPPQPPPSGQTPPWDVKYLDFSDPVKRVASYVGWPLSVVGQDPRRLALCGFFYIGSADRVRCFSCGTTLRNWEPQDSPFQEHLTWAPKCTFIHCIEEPSEEAVAALPDPPCSGPSVAQGTTVADSVAKDAPVAKEAVVAQSNASAAETVVVQEVTAPLVNSAAAEWSSPSTSQQMSGNGGSGVGVPMATTDVMRSPLVLAVVEMGVPEVKVREVIRQRGLVFNSATELYLAAETVSVDSG